MLEASETQLHCYVVQRIRPRRCSMKSKSSTVRQPSCWRSPAWSARSLPWFRVANRGSVNGGQPRFSAQSSVSLQNHCQTFCERIKRGPRPSACRRSAQVVFSSGSPRPLLRREAFRGSRRERTAKLGDLFPGTKPCVSRVSIRDCQQQVNE